jgi:hypothetical protein
MELYVRGYNAKIYFHKVVNIKLILWAKIRHVQGKISSACDDELHRAELSLIKLLGAYLGPKLKQANGVRRLKKRLKLS